jgi:nucleoside-diphosphate-sugar epimerase
VRLFVTGGTGVLGRAMLPLAEVGGHVVEAPRHDELDLFDASAVASAVGDADAILHLATRIPRRGRRDRHAWRENDRLRTVTSRLLVDAGLASSVEAYVQPSVAFVYPRDRPADEDTPIADVEPILRSAVDAERQASRFAAAGRRGVVLRLGLLDGPGTGNDRPDPRRGATLDVADAARALLAALDVPSGTYNVCRDGERISNRRFAQAAGWRPRF